MKAWNLGLALGAIAVAACSSGSSSVPATTSSGPHLVGCSMDRPAVALGPGAQALSPQPSGAPFPCAVATGFTAVDPTLVITPTGTLLFGPAKIPGITSSTDEGMTWSQPATMPDAQTGTLLHPWLWRDAVAKRIFYNVYALDVGACPDGTGASLWTSDDEGVTWSHGAVGCGSADWGKVITGQAATAASTAALAQSGYPDMVYYCATGPTPITGPDHICYRSTDGGKSFTETATHPIVGSGGYPTGGAVGPDGTVYKPKGSPNGLAITMSKDEGDTWNDKVVTGSTFVGTSSKNWLSMNVAADASGALYAVWSDDKDLLPYLSYSKDGGDTWSAPLAIGAPGVMTSAYPSLTVKSPGVVAVAYYGSKATRTSQDGYFNSDGLAYDAYLAVTTNLFAASPVVWSAVISEKPVFTGLSFGVSEYLGYPVFAADGTVWATYVNGGRGLAGRVVFPAGAP